MPDYRRIEIGDVGFIRQGRFHLLFSAGLPLGERQLGVDVPATFKPLSVGIILRGQPRIPGCIRTATVREAGVPGSAPVYTPSGPSSFELTGDSGAALVTKYPTYREDTLRESSFIKYTKRHYESWVAFARDKQYGRKVRPVLVSGFDMTRDFAMAAYSHKDASSESDVTVPMFGSASASTWGTWRARGPLHTNYGPEEPIPPERAVPGFSSLQLAEAKIPSGFNQCVFIRYYTIRKRLGIPRVIRAG